MMTRAELARYIDHTLLKPEATATDVKALISEATELGTFSICVSPSMLPVQAPAGLAVATVVGFPSGKHHAEIKAAEARLARARHADEIDMVIDVGLLKSGDVKATQAEIATVRQACGDVVLKVILESAVLTDDEIIAACKAAENAGADYVKTSTGFHPAGGATEHAVRLMRETVGDRLGVKASGGIRTTAAALAMIEAGASRLGLSASRQILEGLAE